MDEKQDKQRAFQEQRLRHHLEVKSRQIDRVLSERQVSAQVAGGRVAQRTIQFDLQGSLAAGKELLRDLSRELMATMGVADVKMLRDNGRLRLLVKPLDDGSVPLLSLLPYFDEMSPVTAVLGISDDGAPILLDFCQDDIGHILISGGAEAGKSALMQSIALSLAWTNRQSRLQMLLIAPGQEKNKRLESLSYLPHMLAPVVGSVDEASELLGFLFSEMNYRREQHTTTPPILVMIDDVDVLVREGGRPILDPLALLVQHGAEVGLHLVLAASQPDALDELLRSHLSLRLVGRVADVEGARLASGLPDSKAEYLLGQGDFLAVAGELVTHFQAAFVGDYDLHLLLEKLHRQRRQVLLAQPFTMRLTAETAVAIPETELPFAWNGKSVALAEAAPWYAVAEEEDDPDDILFDVRGDGPALNDDDDEVDFWPDDEEV